MIYGSESWQLDAATKRALNGANSRMVSKITGRTVREEATDGKTYDVLASIRATRMRWLGKILQMKEERMVLRAVKMLYHNRKEGDILSDAPATDSWEELRELAKDKKAWNRQVKQIKDQIFIKATDGIGSKGNQKRKNNQTEMRKVEGSKKSASASGSTGGKKEQNNEDKKGDGWSKKRRVRAKHGQLRSRIRCNDGFSMSVQASRAHQCTPRSNSGPYSAVEVSQPNELESYLLPYAEDQTRKGFDIPQLYAQVPATIIRATVSKHLGLAPNSGSLPELIEEEDVSGCDSEEMYGDEEREVDEDGCQWAAAAEPPPAEDSDFSSDLEEATSVMHLGAIPPPPPPLEIEMMSPIPTMPPTASQPDIPRTETPTFNARNMNDLDEAVLHVDARDVFEVPTEEEIEEAKATYPYDNNNY